jgi:hypothetical protein
MEKQPIKAGFDGFWDCAGNPKEKRKEVNRENGKNTDYSGEEFI